VRYIIGLAALALVMLVVLPLAYRIFQNQQNDDPATFATQPISTQGMDRWKTYNSDLYGLRFEYPANYFLAPTSNAKSIYLRQNTYSAAECKTVGKRIGLHFYRLGEVTGIGTIKLTEETAVADIEKQFLEKDDRPQVIRNCFRRNLNGNDAIVCVTQAPGEMPFLTGGIYEVSVFAVFEMEGGERILVKMSNSGGGTPYTGDRALRNDVLRVSHTLHWKQYKK
jgi:hypothetical protein